MERPNDVDRLIRESLEAEGIKALDGLGEPGLPDMVTEVFRGRLRWYGGMFLAMILLCTAAGLFCGLQFLRTEEVPAMLRWGAGLFLCTVAAMGGKNWYWMQMERLAMTREVKRVELLVAQLIGELRTRR
ncbi:MAG: DUF6768 family protein [Acidobacteriota bacterium]